MRPWSGAPREVTVQVVELMRPAGGVLRAYDTGPTGRDDELAVFWHGGTPNIGVPPEPLLGPAAALGIRFLGADRPGYGGTSRDPDAGIADVVPDVLAVADAFGVDRFAVLGHSGGGPRVLACAALAAERVLAAVAVSSPAPADAAGLDRFAGMAPGIVAEQRAVARGREAVLALLASGAFDETSFTAADWAALTGPWAWFGPIVEAAMDRGPDGQADDLLAAARPWGFDLAAIPVPVLLVHGADDRMVPATHSAWLAAHTPVAELRIVPDAGHLSVLADAPHLLAELRRRAEDPMLAHHLGDAPVRTGDGRDTTVHLGRRSEIGDFQAPGEFDVPPAAPVRLVGEIPWELQED